MNACSHCQAAARGKFCSGRCAGLWRVAHGQAPPGAADPRLNPRWQSAMQDRDARHRARREAARRRRI